MLSSAAVNVLPRPADMVVSGRSMVLYSAAGRGVRVSAEEWSSAVRVASRFGWKPAGTRRPPAELGSAVPQSWNGVYEQPAGQEVTRRDALALARALDAAIAWRAAPRHWKALSHFCRRSGFLICPA